MLSVMPTSIFTHFAAMVVLPIPELSSWLLAHYSMYSINNIGDPFPPCLLPSPLLSSPPPPTYLGTRLPLPSLYLSLHFVLLQGCKAKPSRCTRLETRQPAESPTWSNMGVLFYVKACTNSTLPSP
ncbi:hypothetical protein GGR51DRAFT_194303 [Nemania sp. FL0031]|nr:hypothetical protein GGR51DRAFT_194303 [Nemania sp. FL0031]